MNARFTKIKNLNLHASDGQIGAVVDLLIDDNHWTVRYLVVQIDPDSDDQSRQVLISPAAILDVNLKNQSIATSLDSRHVKSSPSLDEDQSVSRQHEVALAEHYGWPTYWLGQTFLSPQTLNRLAGEPNSADATDDVTNLRSSAELCGYQIRSRIGNAGIINDLVVNLRSWRVDNAVADSSSWLPMESSMFLTSHIEAVNWSSREVFVDLSREALLPTANQIMSTVAKQASLFAGQMTPAKPI